MTLMPDAELVVTAYVRSHPSLPPGVVVASGWEGFAAGQTRAVLTRAGGGLPVRQRIDRARIDVEVVAPTKAGAVTAISAVRHMLAEAPGHRVPGVAVVTDTQEESGPAYIEDPGSDQPRYVASWMVDVRPDP